MVNLKDIDAAEKIITLERKLGWFDDKQWEAELREEIDSLRRAFEQRAALETMSRDGMVYGQDGWDRFTLQPDGDIVFMKAFCNHGDAGPEKGGQAAQKIGFTVR